MRPLLLDLYAGAGGAAAGYYRAGFEVIGVDIAPQQSYPFIFEERDALEVLGDLLEGAAPFGRLGHGRTWAGLGDFAGIHASPPCQAFTDLQKQNKREYPDLIGPTRELLEATGLPYVIENVEGAPLRDPIMLCGTMFPGLRVIRHRLFESNFPIMVPPHGRHPLVFTHDKRKAHHGKLNQDEAFVQVTGGGNCTVENKRAAMGVPWMTGAEANEAIPPAYAEHVGQFLMAHIRAEVAA